MPLSVRTDPTVARCEYCAVATKRRVHVVATKRVIWQSISFRRSPHVLDKGRILRALSRMRAELAGEFSLATCKGKVYGSIKDSSC